MNFLSLLNFHKHTRPEVRSEKKMIKQFYPKILLTNASLLRAETGIISPDFK